MHKSRRNAGIVVGIGFVISYTFTLGFDMAMAVVKGSSDLGVGPNSKLTFGQSLDTQICFLSTGVSQLVLFGSLFNLIALVAKGTPKGFSNKQNDNFVVALCFMMFAVYTLSIPAGGVEGFKNGNQILKSVIEHMFNPVLLFIMYFTLPKPGIKTGYYATHQSGGVVGYVGVYIIYAVIRRVVLVKTGGYADKSPFPGDDGKIHGYQYLFPYGVMDPFEKSPLLGIPALLGVMFGPYGLEILFNYLSNLSYKAMFRHDPKLYLSK